MVGIGKIPLLIIVGPTAVGKSKIAIEIAKRFRGEIVSADSVQVYKYLDIGSAKVTSREQQEIKHYMIDIVEPDMEFSVADYQKMALQVINYIASKGKLPILVGGTGLYIKSVVDCYEFAPQGKNIRIRKMLAKQTQSFGIQSLYNKLKKIDPEAAQKIHPHDQRRIVRALEVYYSTGKPISWQVKKTVEKESPFNVLICGIYMQRNKIYQRINNRVDEMISQGFIEEVKNILERNYNPNIKSLQSLGYKHIISYFRGEVELGEAVDTLKRDTRRYAKRQLTWFRKNKQIKWFEIATDKHYHLAINWICKLIQENIFN